MIDIFTYSFIILLVTFRMNGAIFFSNWYTQTLYISQAKKYIYIYVHIHTHTNKQHLYN